MRCPKCGYISFDLLTTCLKCNKNISAASESLEGSVFNVQAPSFLKFVEKSEDDMLDEGMDMFADDDDDDDFVDEDLDILMGDADDDSGIDIEIDDDDDEDEGISAPQLEQEFGFSSEDEDDDGVELDLSQLDADADSDETMVEEDSGFAIDVPEELEDTSDLAPPKKSSAGGESSISLDLDDLDLDLADDGLDGGPAGGGSAKEVELALDDIDFSDALHGSGSGDSSDIDMDGDLNFDLDLGGLSIHSDPKKM